MSSTILPNSVDQILQIMNIYIIGIHSAQGKALCNKVLRKAMPGQARKHALHISETLDRECR
jgi:hypothetical protein